ncbi:MULTISPECIES: biotin transporter BioY [unclassified Candidatus Tisiphia]|uniref:biotin transporter BioY n=1 Tax=unclassified Candidatus Tisiphia TaxID=2996318 RepID=UPI00312C83C4|nr:biotin transporter BioY [Rickettsiaceae bacterium]MDD9337180.1 biotin transporter BioY [Rickettsiaceae bacterium]
MTVTNKKTLANFIANKHAVVVIKVMMGVIALFAGAQIIIPTQPVPVSMQTVVVSIIAFTYSPRLSFATILTYLTAGIVGLPMFTKLSSGLYFLLGTTGGYLIGMLLAAPVMGIINSRLSEKFTKRFLAGFFSCLIGHVIIYFLGVSWLTTIIGIKQAIYSGFIVFIPTGLVKILIFSSLYHYITGVNRKNAL